MLKLKDFLEVADINNLCKVVDVNGKALFKSIITVYEIAEIYKQYHSQYIINCSVIENYFYIIMDIDKRI